MIVYPDFKFRRFTEIDQNFLQTHGLSGLLVDLDNTLVGWHAMDIPNDIANHVASLRKDGIQLCITSNTYNFTRLRSIAGEFGIHFYDGNAGKPGTRPRARCSATCGAHYYCATAFASHPWVANDPAALAATCHA
jgi:predicted HAD superfamily phosphohydrolase YqeG